MFEGSPEEKKRKWLAKLTHELDQAQALQDQGKFVLKGTKDAETIRRIKADLKTHGKTIKEIKKHIKELKRK